MKKILFFALALVSLTSCYEDYVKDYDYSGVYIASTYNSRTFVVGEKNSIEIGAVLSGVLYNEMDRAINYQVDNSLVNSDALAKLKSSATYVREAVSGVEELIPLPSDYYTLSNNSEIVIPSGDHLGTVELTIDSDKFLADPLSSKGNYAFAFKITSSADVDSINTSMSTSVIALKYESMLFGNYWHGGKATVKDSSGTTVDSYTYYTQIPQPDLSVWSLSSQTPTTVKTSKIANGEIDGGMLLSLNSDGSIAIASASDDLIVENDGESTFNQSKLLQDRKLFLNYKFTTEDGNTTFCTDTLTFRNRLRDGVNEWQDENPENYK